MNFFKGMNFFTSNGESESEKNYFPKFRKNSYTWQKVVNGKLEGEDIGMLIFRITNEFFLMMMICLDRLGCAQDQRYDHTVQSQYL